MNDPPDQTAEFKRGELVVGGRDDRAEILAEQVRILAHGRVGVGEDHALLGQVLAERAVDDLALVLGLHAGEELLLGLGNPQLVEGVLDLRRHVFPGVALAVGGLEIIEHVLEIDVDPPAPQRHRLGIEDIQALEAKLPHPRRLALHCRDFLDDLPVQSLAGLEHVVLVVAEIVFIDFAQHILGASFGIRCHRSVETPGRPVKAGGVSPPVKELRKISKSEIRNPKQFKIQ